jgi:hypothetical protein
LALSREDGNSVVAVRVLYRRHPISKAAWDIGVVNSEKGIKQAIVLAVERKYTKHSCDRGIARGAL